MSIESLMHYIEKATCAYTAVEGIQKLWADAGMTELHPEQPWKLERGKGYYVPIRESSVIGFKIPKELPGDEEPLFRIVGSHTDQPCFRIKPAPDMRQNGYYKLNAEVYGGPIYNTWLDRPMSVAGRVTIKGSSLWKPEVRIVDLEEPVLIIPNLAIHMNREVNQGIALNQQTDLIPVGASSEIAGEEAKLLVNALAEKLQVAPEKILDFDLFTYVTEKPQIVGFHKEYLSSPRLDDLSLAWAGAEALVQADDQHGIAVMMALDNEEIGSRTPQGADSAMAVMLLERIAYGLGIDRDCFLYRLAGSFMISADVAHAVHPNRAEKADPVHRPALNGGPVIKLSASQSYMTASTDYTIYKQICEKNGIPVQTFVNRSDMRGGSTIGPVTAMHIPCHIVDMGCPLLSMHSAREMMGVKDYDYCKDSYIGFYNA